MNTNPRNPPNPCVVSLRAATDQSGAEPHASLHDDQSAIVALVDELAILAAELWLEGRLDGVALEEPEDDEDE